MQLNNERPCTTCSLQITVEARAGNVTQPAWISVERFDNPPSTHHRLVHRSYIRLSHLIKAYFDTVLWSWLTKHDKASLTALEMPKVTMKFDCVSCRHAGFSKTNTCTCPFARNTNSVPLKCFVLLKERRITFKTHIMSKSKPVVSFSRYQWKQQVFRPLNIINQLIIIR